MQRSDQSMPEPANRLGRTVPVRWLVGVLLLSAQAGAQDAPIDPMAEDSEDEEVVVLDGQVLTEREVEAIQTESQGSENPDAQRRIDRETAPDPDDARRFELNAYGSVRLHLINAFDLENDTQDTRFGDGASRIGATLDWRWGNGWNLFGRAESGFDVLDTFTTKGQTDSGNFFTPRLYNLSLETENVYAKIGKSWSVYYKVAGAADRFAIFGGEAAGVYNAGTDGGATGTGRADNAFQTEFYIDFERWLVLRPFNLNVQFQSGQSIPQVEGVDYSNAWSLSAWQDTSKGLGIGVAWHRSQITELNDPRVRNAGIDGDAQAVALAFKSTGDRWFASLVLSRLDNIETTDQNKYFNGYGGELFGQWEFVDRWWVTAGGNWLVPEEESKQAGDYEIRYGVLGLRYSLDGLNRMLYAEWRIDDGRFTDGSRGSNEFTVGVRWDLGY